MSTGDTLATWSWSDYLRQRVNKTVEGFWMVNPGTLLEVGLAKTAERD